MNCIVPKYRSAYCKAFERRKVHAPRKLSVNLRNLRNSAIKIAPKNFVAYNNRGNVQAALGNKKLAIADLSKAIQINPSYARAYYNRGIHLSGMGRDQQALLDFNQAIKINGSYLEAYLERGKLYKKIDDARAMQDFKKLLELARKSQNVELEKIAKDQISGKK